MRARYRGTIEQNGSGLDEPIIDLRNGEAVYHGVKPPSTYGYDAVLPTAWKPRPTPQQPTRRPEVPSPKTRLPLPQRFRIEQRFPPMQRIVHHGPIDGADIDVKLTVLESIRLHTTGIEHPMRDLEGRVRDHHYLQLLTDTFGRDRRSLGSNIHYVPRNLASAKREWHMSLAAPSRNGFAVTDKHLVLLEYLPPERDIRRRGFGIAYKRIVIAYQIEVER